MTDTLHAVEPPAAAALPAAVLAGQLDLDAAWARVSAKSGMPGVDGVPVGQFARLGRAGLTALLRALASGAYRPWPLRLAEVPRHDGRARLLLVPAVVDRIAQTAVAQWLGRRVEALFDRASFAYRPGRGVRDALRMLASLRAGGHRHVLDADVQSCFDSIAHDRMIEALRSCLGESCPAVSWIRAWLDAVVWDGHRLTRLDCGIPQGSPLSPLLANIFLDTFDRALREHGVAFVRYADDFLVLAKDPLSLADGERVVRDALLALGLTLSAAKTRRTTFDEGFRFLGAHVSREWILVPFERSGRPKAAMRLAPVMPPALRRAFRAGHLAPAGSFWATRQPREDDSRVRERHAPPPGPRPGEASRRLLDALRRGAR
jgi:CRISPR-associated protein Cas1